MNFNPTMNRLRRDVRIECLFYGEDLKESKDFSKKNHIKSNWIPPCADNLIEEMVDGFERVVLSKKTN